MLQYAVWYLQIIRLNQDTIGREKITVLDLTDVTYDYIANGNLLHLSGTDDGKSVFTLDPALQTSKLPFFGIIIKCRYENYYDNRY